MSRLRISRNFGKSYNSLFLLAISVAVTLLLCSSAPAAYDRPRAGQGILFIRPAFPEQADEIKKIVLYEAPGIDRILVIDVTRLPTLSPSLSPQSGEYVVAVTGKRGNWFRIAYDDAGRDGWIQGHCFWDYANWPDFLPGRTVALLPDLRVSLTEVHQEPLESSLSLGHVSSDLKMRVLEIRDDWARIRCENGLKGWLRWCDGNGKLLIAVLKNGGE
ncbi:MAG: hypothetical protein PHD01_03015 [Geobacteraceae bacterium]|nr:hypothetical protein [Geobacteraceae bacterium]